jgi:hypothetical protein
MAAAVTIYSLTHYAKGTPSGRVQVNPTLSYAQVFETNREPFLAPSTDCEQSNHGTIYRAITFLARSSFPEAGKCENPTFEFTIELSPISLK